MVNEYMMVIMAHPDDVEMCCFGTIKKFINSGKKCIVVIATNGENGVTENELSKDHLIRRIETEKSLANLVEQIIWLDMKDGKLSLDINFVKTIQKLIEKYLPQIIITHFLDKSGVEHQDHNIVGEVVIKASVKYDSNLRCLLLAEPLFSDMTNFKPNYFVNITEFYQAKINAIKKHQTQINKIYMNRYFLSLRATSITPYLNARKSINEEKYEAFQSLFLKID